MKENYWIFKLRSSSVFKLMRRKPGAVTYIESTKSGELLFNLFVRREGVRVEKIQQRNGPAGPMFNLHSVRDDAGRVITFDINHHVLALRRKIVADVLKRFKHLPFYTMQQSKTMLNAFLGMQVARDINGLVFLANYARWKLYRPDQQDRNVLIIPETEWSSILKEDFEQTLHCVIIEKRLKSRFRIYYTLFKHLVRSLLGAGGSEADEVEFGAGSSRVMVTYAMGTLEHKRNDISFFHAVKEKMSASRFLFYFRFLNLYPSEEEQQWFKQNNIDCYKAEMVSENIPSVPLWKPSPGFNAQIETFYKIFRGTALGSLFKGQKHSVWLLDNLWELGWNLSIWKDFFISNNVRVVVHSVPGGWNFIPSAAIAEAGGISVNLERSILFDYCTYFHNAPNHVSFVTGSYSLTQIPEPSYSLHTLQVGGINVGNHPPIAWIDEQKNNKKIVISVFDELPNDWYFGDAVGQFYEALMELVLSDKQDRFVLVIKTKKPEVLDRLSKVKQQVLQLESAGKCLFPDWKVSPVMAAAHSDLVVCVPSTAAFESVLTGTRTIVFSPMKSGSSLFYSNNGLNRRIFENSKEMVSAIRRYADGTDPSVGDCSDLLERIDPYGDGKGARRVGNYLLQCLKDFDKGLTTEEILENANRQFAEWYGDDKITQENRYENG